MESNGNGTMHECAMHRRQPDGGLLDSYCDACRARYPTALLKASLDPFDYALELRDGRVIYFQSCTINGDWITLHLPEVRYSSRFTHDFEVLGHAFPRGLEVSLFNIMWVADAPNGS